ncbi:MAG: cytochrome c4 [Zoogloeaceae bacterium]|nr:cytochrome c4 [Zoogloeaceae bacterium]
MNHVERTFRVVTARKLATAGAALLLCLGMGGFAQANETATTICAACHGADGSTPLAPNYPNLAGLQKEYIVKQLNDFISGKRKSEVMTPMAEQLKPEDIEPVAAYFSQQKPAHGTPDNRMAASAGKVLYNQGNDETGVPACVGCHQEKGAGYLGPVGVYPRVSGQSVEYVKQQLKDFASGARANDQSRFMRTTAKRMSEEEIEEVAQYLVGAGN